MAYTPTTWASGDIISTEKLNKIEQGIVEASSSGGGGIFVIECTPDMESSSETSIRYTHNYTLQQIYDEFISGKQIYICLNDVGGAIKDYFPMTVGYDESSDPDIFINFSFIEYGTDNYIYTYSIDNDYELYESISHHSGGGGIFVIEGTGITSSPNSVTTITFSHNKTLQEVVEAYKSGKQIYFYYNDENTPYGFSLNYVMENVDQDTNPIVLFSGYGKIKQSGIDFECTVRFTEDYVITVEMKPDVLIKFTYDQTNSKYVCNYSFAEIATIQSMSDDVLHGVFIDYNDRKYELTYNGISGIGSSDVKANFQNCSAENGAFVVITLQVPYTGDVSYSYEEFALTPTAVEENA